MAHWKVCLLSLLKVSKRVPTLLYLGGSVYLAHDWITVEYSLPQEWGPVCSLCFVVKKVESHSRHFGHQTPCTFGQAWGRDPSHQCLFLGISDADVIVFWELEPWGNT